MKTRLLPVGIAGTVLALVLGACAQSGSPPVSSAPGSSPAAKPGPTALESMQLSSKDPVPKVLPLPSEMRLSPWTTEIVKLAQAGIEDGVILPFVDTTPGTFNLTADHIIYLTDLGISGDVINLMLQHDSDLALGIRSITASTVPSSTPPSPLTIAAVNRTAEQGRLKLGVLPASLTGVDEGSVDSRDSDSGLRPDGDPNTVDFYGSEFSLPPRIESGPSSMSPSPARTSGQHFYPVREPYPVELTGPILVIQGWSRTPNTVVIEFAR